MSLRRLENRRPQPQKGRKVSLLVPLAVLLGVIIAPIFITLEVRHESHTVTKSQPKVSPSSKPLTTTIPNSQIPGLAQSSQLINPERILPDSNDAALFANQFIQSLPPPSLDCKNQDCVALTFDDGPNAASTKQILDTMQAHAAHASFFEIGNKIAGHENLIKRMYDEGHDIGNHSWSHPSFLKLKPQLIRYQVRHTQVAVAAAGVPEPHLFRPPYEDFLLSMQKDIKLPVILWNVDPKDWAFKDPHKIAKLIERQIKPGAILVLHDRLPTAQALDKVLTDLNDKYKFVTVTELLNLKPDSQGVFIGR